MKSKVKVTSRNKASQPEATHQCQYCDTLGTPASGSMIHSSDVTVGGYLGGTCRPCLVSPSCDICYRHPSESGPCETVHGVKMCKGCSKQATTIYRMMAG